MIADIVERARLFAAFAHAGQTYGELLPYTSHLEDVVRRLGRYGYAADKELIAAAWLHDVIEDTDVIFSELLRFFSEDVANLVWRVTNKPGKNRKERHEGTYPKIRGNKRATALKLADRLANVWASRATADKRLKMYQKERAEFKNALYIRGDGNERMWDDLQHLLADEKRW